MKFYSHSNRNKNYTQAVSLENVRSLHQIDGGGKSAIRFAVRIDYFNGDVEIFRSLHEEEMELLYKSILIQLNK